ncbi:hypothetical protein EV421DRAFT_1906221 [Armillaria borealis]|uniref:Uncharacterized protein n=1 Tax=Armillaria borealis TaxID=47425 RepID=A0AA39JCD6_9AGAR|nr:hypothetical protein EV421DRAFT_1906221 [Armillaria borealis]
MATPGTANISRLAFLQQQLPQCPVDAGLLEKPVYTHKTARAKELRAPMSLIDKCFLTPKLRKKAAEILKFLDDVTPLRDNVQPLYNEQAVAEALYHAVLVPVCHTLNDMIQSENALNTKIARFLRRTKYRVVIRAQQVEEDKSRVDHLIVLESYSGVDRKAPTKKATWSGVQDFHARITELLQMSEEDLMKRMEDKTFIEELPRMVLAIIEEKKAHTINVAHWESILIEETAMDVDPETDIDVKPSNLTKMSVQLRKYSWITRCPYTVLADYINVIPVYVEQCSIKMGDSGPIGTDETARLWWDKEAVILGPRYKVFAVALMCLLDAQVAERPEGYEPTLRRPQTTDPVVTETPATSEPSADRPAQKRKLDHQPAASPHVKSSSVRSSRDVLASGIAKLSIGQRPQPQKRSARRGGSGPNFPRASSSSNPNPPPWK